MADSDKKKGFYQELIEKFTLWVREFHLFYNTMEGEKDCGVPKDRIRLMEAII